MFNKDKQEINRLNNLIEKMVKNAKTETVKKV